jgi:hypothetical protein
MKKLPMYLLIAMVVSLLALAQKHEQHGSAPPSATTGSGTATHS